MPRDISRRNERKKPRHWAPLLICALAPFATARDKFGVSPKLSSDDAIWLSGSTVLVTRHDQRGTKFQARSLALGYGLIYEMTGGKEVHKLEDANVWDPADIFELELVPAIVKQFGLQPAPQGVRAVEADSWTDVAAEVASSGADYLLDLRTTYRRALFRKGFNDDYWVGYGISVTLLERKSARLIFHTKCYSDTVDHPDSPPLRALAENGARLYVDVSASLAWKCLQQVAGALLPDPGVVAPVPRQLVDPLAAYARNNPDVR
jgi:hypothetical protein